MKLVCYREGGAVRYGAVQDGRIVELSSRLGDCPDIVSFIAKRDLESANNPLKTTTKVVHVETQTNRLVRVTDLDRVARIAHRAGAIPAVGATFTTPGLRTSNPARCGPCNP